MEVDAEIILTACNVGAGKNGGVKLLEALSKATKRTVYGNQSFTPGRMNLFQGGSNSPAYYTESERKSREGIPGYSEKVYPRAYSDAGNWTKVTYSEGTTTTTTIKQPYFDSFGKFRYNQ